MLAYLILWILLLTVMVWRRVPPAAVTIVRAPEDAAPFQLDLNQAPWEQLTLIDGIGETLARRIVAARERRGHFESLEEVMQLPGIPDRPFEAAREWLAVGTDGVDRLRD